MSITGHKYRQFRVGRNMTRTQLGWLSCKQKKDPEKGWATALSVCVWLQLPLYKDTDHIGLQSQPTPPRYGASLVALMVKILPAMRRPRFNPWVGKILWKRKWQPAPGFWPGEFQGQRSLAGYNPRSCKESDVTKRLIFSHLRWLDFQRRSHFKLQGVGFQLVDFSGTQLSV